MKRKYILHSMLFLSLFLLLSLSAPAAAADGSIKSVRVDTGQSGSYAIWQEGAMLQLSQAEEGIRDGSGALRVDLVDANNATGADSGSFYHILPETRRDWSQTEFMRFWLKNASDEKLLLNFSFKEAASEDWGLGASGLFYLQDADGMFYASEYSYCNLEIPAQYQGYVILPFSSLVVPDWSTAKGDRRLELSNIETYAFGAQYSGASQTFYLDEMTVTSLPDYRVVSVRSEGNVIEIPDASSSETLIGADVTDLGNALKDQDVVFTLEQDTAGITLSKDGMLSVEKGAEVQAIVIKAAVKDAPQYFHRCTVYVVKDKSAPLPADPLQAGQGSDNAAVSPVTIRYLTPQQIAFIAAAAVTVLIIIAAVISARVRAKARAKEQNSRKS